MYFMNMSPHVVLCQEYMQQEVSTSTINNTLSIENKFFNMKQIFSFTILLRIGLCIGLSSSFQSAAAQIEISRKSITDQCIMGYLLVDGEVICYTLELPYVGNINDISTIPAGKYTGFVREDGSKGWRIELDDVAGRENIQIHVGNYTNQIMGCTLVGMGANVDDCTVSESQKARNALKSILGPLVNQGISVTYSN
jgi:hypothetical protein